MGIDSGSLIFKKVFAGKASSDNTKPFFEEAAQSNARLSVFSGDVWSEAHLIPDSGIGHITGSVAPGDFTASGVVKYYSASGFGPIAGQGFGFSSSVQDWIPFNFGDGTSYFYKLLANNGQEILISDPSNWTFDTEAGVLIFHNGYPIDPLDGTQLVNNTTLLPSMSAYAYTGKKLSNSGYISSSIQFPEIADFQSFSSSFSQSVVNFVSASQSIATEIDNFTSFSSSFSQSVVDFQSFSSSFSESVVNFQTFSSSIENAISTKEITASAGLFFSGSTNKDYVIDYAKIRSSSGELVPESGSLTITASGLKVEGDIDGDGNITLDGTLSFSGFNFSENSTSVTSGSTQFGSGSTGSNVQATNHQFTGSVFITGSNLTLTNGILAIPGYGNVANTLGTFLVPSDTASFLVPADTASFLVPADTASFLVPADTASFLVPSDTASFLVPSDTASFLVPSDTASFLVPSDTASFLVPSDTASFITNADTASFLVPSDTASFLVPSDTASFITNADTASFLIPSDTASFITNSDTASFLVPSDTASFITNSDTASFVTNSDTASFVTNSDTASFVTNSDTASFAITSSNVSFSDITASGNVSASGLLFFSASETNATNYQILVQNPADGRVYTTGSVGGGGSSVATQITLGADTTGNLPLGANTTVQSSIDQINSILDLLAPTSPPQLSAIILGFSNTTNYSAIDINGNTVTSITNDTTPSFSSSEAFLDGDGGVLRAQHFPSSSGAIGTGHNSSFSIFDITLNNDVDDTGVNNILQIVSDTDPYAGQAGSSGFFKVLSAKINLSGLTPNNTGDYQRNTVRLIHTQTGPNGIDKEFTLDTDDATEISSKNFTASQDASNYHIQSGIKYLGVNNIVQPHYNVKIPSNANFINTDKKLSLVRLENTFGTRISQTPSPTKNVTTATWAPGDNFNITSSLEILDNVFVKGNAKIRYYVYKASSTSNAGSSTINITQNGNTGILIDSKQENEIKPNNGASFPLRVKSGKGQYPDFGTSTGEFGDTFNSSSELTTSDEYELQFANEYFHWPASTNYSNYIPAGPNYSSISGDDTSGFTGRRYATFKLGDIEDAQNVTLTFKSTCGFDNSTIQTSDGFQLHLKVMNGTENITSWIDGNASFEGTGNTIGENGAGGVNPDGNVSSGGNFVDFVRIIAFGNVTVTGTVYVRVGWKVGGGTDATSTSTRKFKYITKS